MLKRMIALAVAAVVAYCGYPIARTYIQDLTAGSVRNDILTTTSTIKMQGMSHMPSDAVSNSDVIEAHSLVGTELIVQGSYQNFSVQGRNPAGGCWIYRSLNDSVAPCG